jgi:hypothetical protein
MARRESFGASSLAAPEAEPNVPPGPVPKS